MPNLPVEVVSPTDPADALLVKVREYLRAGARLVWVIYPGVREVHVYLRGGQIRVYFDTDDLDAPDVLPGFGVPVASLFPPVADLPVPNDDQ
ncbi:MAG: Uma2 family endonuclease [Gemmataceae bacterium]|nr:Uma2 family endonuclease [Gemmataceae bacterium]